MADPRIAINYFANVRFPSERANSIQIIRMCSAFSRVGGEVTLCFPWRINRYRSSAPTLHAHYDVSPDFRTKQLFSLDLIDLLPLGCQPPAFRLQSFTFGLRAVLSMWRTGQVFFYIRDNATLALSALLLPSSARHRLFYEAHDFPVRPASAGALLRAARKCGGVVSITRGLQRRFEETGLPLERLHVAPDGVDLADYQSLPAMAEARERLDLPREGRIAVYAGQLFPWKGVDTLVRAASFLPGCKLVFVGGSVRDRQRLRSLSAERNTEDRVRFIDQVPPGEVKDYLCAADILVLPNSGKFPISAEYTSPMKLFEYMAAQRPIVATDLPSLREVLRHEENALLVRPDDPEALAGAMARLLTDKSLGDKLRSCASREVRRYTWEERARGISAFIQTTVKGKAAS
ncbi:MAG: glycosyltransferase family 4 protein [Planctomycetes bacterium]|nr:glycosyltransferase family 4 protein [Planctomycetota bacterium]